MKCPSCGQPLPAAAPRCPRCNISLVRLDMKFGLVPRHKRYLSDRTGRLAAAERRALRGTLRLFRRKFPQILFSVLFLELPAGYPLGEYAFWTANRARLSSVEKTGSENFDLLLMIDLNSKSSALTAGYGLEPWVTEEDLQDGLKALVPALLEGDFARAIHACIGALIPKLRESSDRARTQTSVPSET